MRPTREWLSQPGGLAGRLRAMRKKVTGLTQDQLAEQARWTRSKVPKIEGGRQMPTEADIRAWARITGQEDEIPGLLALLGDAEAVYRQWQLGSGGHEVLSGQLGTLIQDATVIRGFDAMVIPPLLQTPEYARYRALESVRVHGADPGRVDHVVAVRMDWQRALFTPGKAFTFVICQAALEYLLCPPQVMSDQFAQLATFSRLPNLTLGIIPPGRELPVTPLGDFLMTDNTVMVETFNSMITLSVAEAPKYIEFTGLLMAEAVTGDEARRLVAAAAADLRES